MSHRYSPKLGLTWKSYFVTADVYFSDRVQRLVQQTAALHEGVGDCRAYRRVYFLPCPHCLLLCEMQATCARTPSCSAAKSSRPGLLD